MRFWKRSIRTPAQRMDDVTREICVAGILAAYFTSLASLLYGWVARLYSGDFFMFYNAAQRPWVSSMIYRMEEAELYMQGKAAFYAPYIYAPHFLFALRSMRGADPFWAEFFWQGANALLLIGVILLPVVRRYAHALAEGMADAPMGNASRLTLMALCLMLPGVMYLQMLGHPSLSATACVILAVALLNTHPIFAGILFGWLTYKIQLVLLVPILLLSGRYWRALAAMAATVLVLMLTATAIFGWEVWIDYYQLMVRHAEVMREKHGQSIIRLFVSSYALAIRLGAPEMLAMIVQILTGLVGVYGVVRAGQTRNPAAMLLMLAAGTVFASPYIYLYDMMPVLFCVAMLAYQPTQDVKKRVLIFLMALWPLLVFPRSAQWAADGLLLAGLVWVLGYEWLSQLPHFLKNHHKA